MEHGENKCGNRLYCGHFCRGRPGEGHMCSCPFKWTLDPGCGHMLAGSCSISLLEAVNEGCLATCRLILDCEHECQEACSSPCVCPDPDCESKASIANQGATIVVITPAPIEQENEKREDQKIESEVEMEIAALASVRKPMKNLPPRPPREIPTVKNVPIKRRPVLKLTIPQPSQNSQFIVPNPNEATYVSEQDSPQPSASRAATATNHNENTELKRRVNQPERKSADEIPQNQIMQIRKLVPASFLDKTVKNPYHLLFVFTQCKNAHLFSLEEDTCPECGCPDIGPYISIFKEGIPMDSNAADQNNAEMVQQTPFLQDELEDAWKLGLAKCSSGHYFSGDSPRCHICGEPSILRMDDLD